MGADSEFLNEQQRILLLTCKHIDSLPSDMEATLNAAASKSPSPNYTADLPRSLRGLVGDYITRMRAERVRVTKGQPIGTPEPKFPAHLRSTRLSDDIDGEELSRITPETVAGLQRDLAVIGMNETRNAPVGSRRRRL